MSYKLREDETLGDGMRRVICGQIEGAIAAGNTPQNGNTSPIHATRKCLKRARAALRMIAAEAGRRPARRENRCLRDVARMISEIRDAEVRLQTVKQLRDLFSHRQDRNFLETEELLAFELDSFLAAFSDWEEEARTKLSRARDRVAKWPLGEVTCETLRRAAQRSYKRGRTALREAVKNPTADEFHNFRKEAKQLWYQLRVLRPLHPVIFKDLGTELKTIAQHLGHAHDLAFLAARLKSAGRGRKRSARVLGGLIEAREEELQRRAAVLAERFYAQRPRDFGRRISEYFAEWEIAKRRCPRGTELAAI
ncbi:MAG: CHAD domain-containing protein [Chthoniobacterales bacterium]